MRLVKGLEDARLKEAFERICEQLQQANLVIIDKNHVETMEAHLQDPNYSQYAFASIQCDGGKFVELRFPKRHLAKVQAYQAVDRLEGLPWRKDSAKFVRFQFREWTPNSQKLLNKIVQALKDNIQPVVSK